MFFIFAAAVTALFFLDTDTLNQRAEAYLLLMAAALGIKVNVCGTRANGKGWA